MEKYNKTGINNNTWDILFNNEDKSLSIDSQNIQMLMTIDTFTKILHKKLLFKLIELYKVKNLHLNLDNIKYNEENKMYEYNENQMKVPFKVFSEEIIETQKKFLKELQSEKRKEKCHLRTIQISLSFENSKILTGIIHFGNHKVLHSILEYIDKDNNNMIIDWTTNTIMPKETFYNIYDFKLLNIIDPSTIEQDFEILHQLNLGYKAYLVFRDELMRDIEKNGNIFDNITTQRSL